MLQNKNKIVTLIINPQTIYYCNKINVLCYDTALVSTEPNKHKESESADHVPNQLLAKGDA